MPLLQNYPFQLLIVLHKHASNLTVPCQASKVYSLPQREEKLRETWKIVKKTPNTQFLYSS